MELHAQHEKDLSTMASRPPPPGRRGHGVRAASVLRKFPLAASTTENKSTTAPQRGADKPVSSGFASARAIFEAKQKQTQTLPSSSAPPVGTRFQPPSSVVSVVAPAKEQRASTFDFSSSTCSTVDSEGDRELKDSVDTPADKQEEAVSVPSWQRPWVSEKNEQQTSPPHVSTVKQTIAALEGDAEKTPRPVQRSWPPHNPTVVAAESPVVISAPPAAPTAVETPLQPQGASDTPKDEEFHPFRLLLPVEKVPVLPYSVACVYDEAAAEMQKNIKKVVRKLLHKNKARQEEFKVNARLFGNDFMDASDYLSTLIQDFGAVRALQLVPCLLSIQPDDMKRSNLLLAAKNYRLRNLEALEKECQTLQSVAATPAKTPVQAVETSVVVETSAPVERPVVHEVSVKNESGVSTAVSSATPGDAVPIAIAVEAPAPTPIGANASARAPKPVQIAANVAVAVAPAVALEAQATPVLAQSFTGASVSVPEPVQASAVLETPTIAKKVVVEPADLLQLSPSPADSMAPAQPNSSVTKEAVLEPAAASLKAVNCPKEPVPEPLVSQSSQMSPSKTSSTSSTVKARTSSTASDEEDEFQAETLFGEPIKPAVCEQQRTASATTASASVSSSDSFDDAESLFGERLSVASRPSTTSKTKTVTWGEPQRAETPSPSESVQKPAPAPMIFGAATFGAYPSDSDSDDSDFSD